MFPSSFQRASQLDEARAAVHEENDLSESYRDVLSVLHHNPSPTTTNAKARFELDRRASHAQTRSHSRYAPRWFARSLVRQSLLSSKLKVSGASTGCSCVQVSENHPAEVVIVSEPEGTSLQMGGASFVRCSSATPLARPLARSHARRLHHPRRAASQGVAVRTAREHDSGAGHARRVQAPDAGERRPRIDSTVGFDRTTRRMGLTVDMDVDVDGTLLAPPPSRPSPVPLSRSLSLQFTAGRFSRRASKSTSTSGWRWRGLP